MSIKSNYSRKVFSRHSFDYITSYDTAVYTFYKNNTFEVSYKNGITYKGFYKIYNDFYVNAII